MRSRPLSSTTERASERGQTIVLFVLALVVLMAFAALAFDVGQTLVDRRSQQDAADAAALAGARYLTDSGCQPDSTLGSCPNAVTQALSVALANGYGTGQNGGTDGAGRTVTVKIPPGPESPFADLSGYIEVQIGTRQGTTFGNVLGIANLPVGAMAVAANQSGIAPPYSFLALNPTACPSALFSGQGDLSVGGNIQVDSSCPSAALQVTGQATVTVTVPNGACDVTGGIQQGGGGTLNCQQVTPAPALPDPLAQLAPPPVPAAALPAVEVAGTTLPIPPGCPGGSAAASAANPATCQFTSSYAGTTWRLFPGYYPGGIKVQGGSIYLEPGIYYLGGGGFSANGTSASVCSVSAGGTICDPNPDPGGDGVLLYNTQDAVFASQCAAGTAPNPSVDCLQPISFMGSSTIVQLDPLEMGTLWDGLVVFQDRTLSMSPTTTPLASRTPDLVINGNGANMSVDGTIYEPSGYVQINGNNGTNTNSQVIADEFKITGNSGTMTVSYNGSQFYQLSGVGLVQ